MSRNSSATIATAYGLDDRIIGVRFPAEAGNSSLRHHVQTSSEVHPVSYPVGTRGTFPAVKWPWHEADRLHPSSSEVKECMEIYLHSSMVWFLVKRRDNFTFP